MKLLIQPSGHNIAPLYAKYIVTINHSKRRSYASANGYDPCRIGVHRRCTGEENVPAQLEMLRPQIEDAAKQDTMIASLFSYRTLSDGELMKYLDFYHTEAGAKYAHAAMSGISEVLQEGFGRAFIKYVK